MATGITTNQAINNYYDLYRENEIVFTKDILRSLRVDPRQIYVKCGGGQWSCIINSTSLQMAKIIIGTAGGAYQQITKKDAPPVSLRYYFIEPDNQPLMFFVSCKVTEVTPYMNSKDLVVITLTFTQRPPDDLISKLGVLLDANASFVNRKEERITIDEQTQNRLGLQKRESTVYIQSVPRRAILWNISFSGAKLVVMGMAAMLLNKEIIIRFNFIDPDEVIDIKGTIVKAANVDNKKGLVEVGIKFDEAQVPLAYKLRINSFLTTNRKFFLERGHNVQEKNSEQV